MNMEERMSLRQRAALAWKNERPLREAARVEKQARQIEAVHAKLEQIFGPGSNIKLGLSPQMESSIM